MKGQMKGQLSLFGMADKTAKHPYDYTFQRYIGQKVVFWRDGIIGKIVKIEPYYTIVDTGKCYMAGTNTTIAPYRAENEG